jgi:hypothetical protein
VGNITNNIAPTTSTYTQLVASTTTAITKLYIFDSSESAMIIATGAAASEVDQIYVPPGGSSAGFELAIPASTRISLKALDVAPTGGQGAIIVITGLN